jgi:hypothetical protein
MKSLKSLFKPNSNGGGKVTAAPSTSGSAGGGGGEWEDFSEFSNNIPTINQEPHPLTEEWGKRINNRNVRAAFLTEPIEGYTAAHDLRVWTGTWNTNGKSPPPHLDISQWLKFSSSSEGSGAERHPDVVVVGFQEIVPLTPGKVLAGEDTAATAEWEAIIGEALNGGGAFASTSASTNNANNANNAAVADPFVVENLWSGKPVPAAAAGEGEWTSFDAPSAAAAGAAAATNRPTYVRLACKQLVGVYITVWATVDVASHARDVRVNTVSTGFNLGLGVLGNKGGAAVWMKVYATPVVGLYTLNPVDP